MKKKFLIIISIILFVLFVLGLITSFKDSARVRAGIEPKYTIKLSNADGSKVTYLGLGYKVIRYTSVSPNEPYKNNRGVKYGSWFMKYELEDGNKRTLNPVETNDHIINYLENNAYSNLSYNYVDTESGKVIVGLIDNSKEKQEEFINEVFSHCCGSIYIKNLKEQKIITFEKGEYPKDLDKSQGKIIVEENSPTHFSSFDIYLERDGIVIYKVPNIKEIYYQNSDTKISMKDYISNTFQTTDDGIKYFTDLLGNPEILKDGGTKVYKSKEYNITLVKCNTVDGNKDIFIGNYETKFDSEKMCRR